MSNDGSPETDRRDAETNRIAAEGNRMVAEDARVVTDKARTEDEKIRRLHRRRLSMAQTGAYVLIVAVGLFAFYQTSRQQDDLCEGAVENREALRDVIVAITNLGTDLTGDDEPEQTEMLAEFERDQLAILTVPVCE